MIYSKLIFILLALKYIEGEFSNKILLTVYYESNCPDSEVFILKQLQPALHLLHNYVGLKLVPFGKSQSLNYGDDGFICQHGAAECLGNIIQDCALYHMKDTNDLKKTAYVACEMETRAASQGRLDCVVKATPSPRVIEDCALSGKGTILQLESEYYTSLVKPKFIPTITVNGIFDQQLQDNAQIDLIGTLCSIVTQAPPCAHLYNKKALMELMYDDATFKYSLR